MIDTQILRTLYVDTKDVQPQILEHAIHKINCRKEKKRHDPGVYYGVCSMCGKEVVFKFKPSRDRPIYCDKCKKIMLQEA